jgi:hypothetical protein
MSAVLLGPAAPAMCVRNELPPPPKELAPASAGGGRAPALVYERNVNGSRGGGTDGPGLGAVPPRACEPNEEYPDSAVRGGGVLPAPCPVVGPLRAPKEVDAPGPDAPDVVFPKGV